MAPSGSDVPGDRGGFRGAARLPLSQRRWKFAVSAWLAFVLLLFFWIRIWSSSAVTHLLQRLAAR
jgi:hypothetical protein